MASRRSRRSSQDKDDDYLYESDNTSEYEEEEEDEDDEFDIATVKKTNKRKHEGDDSDSSSESDHSSGCKNKKCEGSEAKKRRVRYGWACTMCKLKHRSCDGQRPCGRCKSEGFADTCSDGPCCGSGSASEVCRGKEPNFLSEIKKEEKDACSSSYHQACATAGRMIKQEPGCQKPSSLSLLEHKIVAKVAEAVAIRVDALTGASSGKQPFLFQFLEPPKRVIGSSVFPPTPQMVSRALNPYWPEKLFPQSFNFGGQYVAPSAPMPSPKFSAPFLPEESFAPLQPLQQQQAMGFATTFVERAGQPCWNVPNNNCQQGYETAYPIESSACGEDNTFYSQNDFEAFLA